MDKKKKEENQEMIDSYDYLSNAASSWDCTGLIPSAPLSRAELESYEDIYHFTPPALPPETDSKTDINAEYDY